MLTFCCGCFPKVDAWAKSGEGGAAATRAEAILQHMNTLYQKGGHDSLRPTTGIFNAVINAWARSREQIAPMRAEQILEWMDKLHRNGNLDIQPDKYTFNTVIHAWAKLGGKEAAEKAQSLLDSMHRMNRAGNMHAKPDTITVSGAMNSLRFQVIPPASNSRLFHSITLSLMHGRRVGAKGVPRKPRSCCPRCMPSIKMAIQMSSQMLSHTALSLMHTQRVANEEQQPVLMLCWPR